MAVACELPEQSDRPITHWTTRELADEVIKREIVPSISARTVGRILDGADLKPHQSRYWLNPKIEDPEAFDSYDRKVCDLYQDAPELAKNAGTTASCDEKTGIQALSVERPLKSCVPFRKNESIPTTDMEPSIYWLILMLSRAELSLPPFAQHVRIRSIF